MNQQHFAFVTTDSNGDHDVLFVKVTSDEPIDTDQVNQLAKQGIERYNNESDEVSRNTREDCIIQVLEENGFTVTHPIKSYTTLEIN